MSLQTLMQVQTSANGVVSRRTFLRSAVAGSLLMPAILHELLAGDAPADPLAPRPAHWTARAKRVIFLFMSGGPSHLELFDPKPDLQRLHGTPLPASFGPVATIHS